MENTWNQSKRMNIGNGLFLLSEELVAELQLKSAKLQGEKDCKGEIACISKTLDVINGMIRLADEYEDELINDYEEIIGELGGDIRHLEETVQELERE